jgi:hypothetical protein
MDAVGHYVRITEKGYNTFAGIQLDYGMTDDINKATVFGFSGERFLMARTDPRFKEIVAWCDKNCIKIKAQLRITRKVVLVTGGDDV